MTIGFANDHRGYELKEKLKTEIEKRGYNVIDYGTDSNESTDYPDYAFRLGKGIVNKEVDFGVAICGSGIGISIACNKVKGVRCAKVTTSEEARTTRNDNNSNVVAFGEKVPLDEAIKIIESFITTPFSVEEKHHRRVNKIVSYEEGNYDI